MLNNVSLMERTDSLYLGRVMSVTMMAFGINSIASYPVGLIADAVGERATLAGLACACLSVVALGVIAMRATAGQTSRRAAAVEAQLTSTPRA